MDPAADIPPYNTLPLTHPGYPSDGDLLHPDRSQSQLLPSDPWSRPTSPHGDPFINSRCSPSSSMASSAGAYQVHKLQMRLAELTTQVMLLSAENRYIKETFQTLLNAISAASPTAVPDPQGDSGGPGVDDMGYIEDENGKAVDEFRVSVICQTAYRIWFQFANEGISPRTWESAPSSVVHRYCIEMAFQIPEMRYCAEHWKAQHLATQLYPLWYAAHGSKQIMAEDPADEAATAKRPRATSSLPPQKRTKANMTELETEEPRSEESGVASEKEEDVVIDEIDTAL